MRLSIRLFSALGRLQLAVLLCAAATGSESLRSNSASTVIVTSTANSGPGSLRQALADANDGDTIQFDAALNGQTIGLTSGRLVINKNITISGPGPDVLTVSRDQNAGVFRILHVMPGHTVIIEGLTISGGHSSAEPGGGIFSEVDATLTINNCTVSENFADGGDGGGGINCYGPLTITNSTVKLNRASFTFGNPTGDGGGIKGGYPLTIINSVIAGNTAAFRGGGILGSGTITIINSTISGNWAGSHFDGSGFGGGIYSTGILNIRNSTISGNTASGNGSGIGGGIVSGGTGTLTITNSTLSGNFANQDGGGILNDAPLVITNSTISGNGANRNGGGIINYSELEIGNAILKAGASGANIFNNGGSITSRGYNLSSDDGGGSLTATGDQTNTDPKLGPLQNNGGSTFTHAPLPGSPAIDAGDPNFTPPPLSDQRGYDRVFNGRIDIGSLEVQPAPTPGPTPTPTATPTSTPTPTATPSVTPTPASTPTPTTSPTATPSPTPARALNISTRLRVETGDKVMIGGFIIAGDLRKSLAVRGIGPSLAASGISDALADPTLDLRDGSGALLFQNDNWQDNPAQAAQLTALGLAPTDLKESGIAATLEPGAYTTIMAGKDQTAGIGLVEVYDADATAASQLANISTRGFVQTGDDVMIGGFILGGSSASAAVAVRGIGPSLSQSGLSNLLADPTLELRDSNGMLLISNDNWQDDPAVAEQLTEHGLAPQDPLESGIFSSLPTGAFTAILAGKNGGTGIGLVEIYDVQ